MVAAGVTVATVLMLLGWYLLLYYPPRQLLSPLLDVWMDWNAAARRASTIARLDQDRTSPGLTVVDIEMTVVAIRGENNLPDLSHSEALTKFARLLTLEVEDQQTLELENTQEILAGLVPQPPKRVETILLFLPSGGRLDWQTQLQSETVLQEEQFTQIGIATRSAEYQSTEGIIAALIVSTDFPSPKPSQTQTNTPVSARPNFTGQELWQAVQVYRRAHNLPEFQMHPELCTVSAIRLNEQLELGKLDNHAGFQAQSDAFFKKNPDWTGINENLAAGYETATQTVEWGWDQSLGHQALIKSREFPYACASASYGFSVLITGK